MTQAQTKEKLMKKQLFCCILRETAPIKSAKNFIKIHTNQEKMSPFAKNVPFLWKLLLFSGLVRVSHIKWRPTALK